MLLEYNLGVLLNYSYIREPAWAFLGSPGLSWALLGSPGLPWALLGSFGLSFSVYTLSIFILLKLEFVEIDFVKNCLLLKPISF